MLFNVGKNEAMDLTSGFQIHSPTKFIPWRLRELELEDLLDGKPLRKIRRGYYTLDCEPLPDLHCILGFHLHRFDVFTELEFSKNMRSFDELSDNYDCFQRHFEDVFGRPATTGTGNEGFPSHEWDLPGARIVHHVVDRFGPEEHMRITKK